MLFGSNHPEPIAGQTAYRLYYGGKNGIPVVMPMVPAGMTPIISIRPDIELLLAWELDKNIRGYFQNCFQIFGAPVLMTAYHEANDPKEEQDPAKILAVHKHMAKLAADSMLVYYGVIVGCYPVQHESQDLTKWIPPGMDWAGMDGYRVEPTDTPEAVFDPARSQLERLAHSVLITETNVFTDSAEDLQAQADWMIDALSYADAHGMAGFLVYYNHPGTTVPPAPSPAMMASMSIQAATAGIA